MADYKKYLDPEILSRISRLELRARRVVEGFVSGMHRSPYHGFSVEFAAHREYVPGDDIRHIDWRLYARGDRLYIKQYEEETNLRTTVLLDCSASMLYPEHDRRAGSGILSRAGRRPAWRNKYDYAATLAASLIYLLMHQQDACGLVLFDHEIREQVPPTSQTAQLRAMIDLIERRPPSGATDVKMTLTGLAERMRRRGLVVLISDLLTDPQDVISGLQQLKHRGQDLIVMHVLDEDELKFPFSDNTLFEGIEQPVHSLVDPQALRASYLEIVGAFISRIRSACMDHGIDYVLLSTADPLDAGLSAYLARRMHRTSRR
ncbi:MAG TPA: DUF58 domain-containing protein [Phycisphaerae bacterium]|nr:DUF58 domain-containing protein [Phycisphaerae bacterium]HOJ72539.1 DUF58 domain-containing protein [Phycisphaerae bacterium]HOM49800.1 DUF58 domain-containing protein [Phycisphaerae bacterium]HON66812.1 DUF58 domain-containing protein [Phycisphaerae bacterium]HOQ84246.1 DUF58 domain-containing protein [Phycisphaerae bacterium]